MLLLSSLAYGWSSFVVSSNTAGDATKIASTAIELGAAAATIGTDHVVSIMLPFELSDDTGAPSESFAPLLARTVGGSSDDLIISEAEPLYQPHDWYGAQELTFVPQLIGRKLWVTPATCDDDSHLPYRPSGCGCIHLRLLDSVDDNVFLRTTSGTLHSSTVMILSQLVERRAELRGVFLDYGCGSGVLSLAALALGHVNLRAYGTDIVEAALSCARRNAQINAGTLDASRLRLDLPWEVPRHLQADVAVANMLPGPLIDVSPELAQRVRPGGLLLLSGFRQRDLAAVRAAFTPYFHVSDSPVMRRDGWLCVACERQGTALDAVALSESAVV